MANSIVEIANASLAILGDKPITSIDDDNDRARWIKSLYPITRDAVLRSRPWNFASVRISLAQDATAPEWGYNYRYTLPPDCLRVFNVKDSEDYDWRIEGRYLLTDLTSVKIFYVRKEENPVMYDSLFTECLSIKLAAYLAVPIAGNRNLSETMHVLYDKRIREASAENTKERSQQKVSSSVLTDVR